MYFFLSGLRWHIPGLSELPPQQRLLLLLVGDSLFSSSFCSRRRAFFFQLSTSCDLLFCTYEHVIVEHLPRAQPSTAHQSCTKQQEQVHDRSERDNASRKTALARASTPSSIYTQLAAFSKRTKESKSARPTPAYIQESFFGLQLSSFASHQFAAKIVDSLVRFLRFSLSFLLGENEEAPTKKRLVLRTNVMPTFSPSFVLLSRSLSHQLSPGIANA